MRGKRLLSLLLAVLIVLSPFAYSQPAQEEKEKGARNFAEGELKAEDYTNPAAYPPIFNNPGFDTALVPAQYISQIPEPKLYVGKVAQANLGQLTAKQLAYNKNYEKIGDLTKCNPQEIHNALSDTIDIDIKKANSLEIKDGIAVGGFGRFKISDFNPKDWKIVVDGDKFIKCKQGIGICPPDQDSIKEIINARSAIAATNPDTEEGKRSKEEQLAKIDQQIASAGDWVSITGSEDINLDAENGAIIITKKDGGDFAFSGSTGKIEGRDTLIVLDSKGKELFKGTNRAGTISLTNDGKFLQADDAEVFIGEDYLDGSFVRAVKEDGKVDIKLSPIEERESRYIDRANKLGMETNRADVLVFKDRTSPNSRFKVSEEEAREGNLDIEKAAQPGIVGEVYYKFDNDNKKINIYSKGPVNIYSVDISDRGFNANGNFAYKAADPESILDKEVSQEGTSVHTMGKIDALADSRLKYSSTDRSASMDFLVSGDIVKLDAKGLSEIEVSGLINSAKLGLGSSLGYSFNSGNAELNTKGKILVDIGSDERNNRLIWEGKDNAELRLKRVNDIDEATVIGNGELKKGALSLGGKTYIEFSFENGILSRDNVKGLSGTLITTNIAIKDSNGIFDLHKVNKEGMEKYGKVNIFSPEQAREMLGGKTTLSKEDIVDVQLLLDLSSGRSLTQEDYDKLKDNPHLQLEIAQLLERRGNKEDAQKLYELVANDKSVSDDIRAKALLESLKYRNKAYPNLEFSVDEEGFVTVWDAEKNMVIRKFKPENTGWWWLKAGGMALAENIETLEKPYEWIKYAGSFYVNAGYDLLTEASAGVDLEAQLKNRGINKEDFSASVWRDIEALQADMDSFDWEGSTEEQKAAKRRELKGSWESAVEKQQYIMLINAHARSISNSKKVMDRYVPEVYGLRAYQLIADSQNDRSTFDKLDSDVNDILSSVGLTISDVSKYDEASADAIGETGLAIGFVDKLNLLNEMGQLRSGDIKNMNARSFYEAPLPYYNNIIQYLDAEFHKKYGEDAKIKLPNGEEISHFPVAQIKEGWIHDSAEWEFKDGEDAKYKYETLSFMKQIADDIVDAQLSQAFSRADVDKYLESVTGLEMAYDSPYSYTSFVVTPEHLKQRYAVADAMRHTALQWVATNIDGGNEYIGDNPLVQEKMNQRGVDSFEELPLDDMKEIAQQVANENHLYTNYAQEAVFSNKDSSGRVYSLRDDINLDELDNLEKYSYMGLARQEHTTLTDDEREEVQDMMAASSSLERAGDMTLTERWEQASPVSMEAADLAGSFVYWWGVGKAVQLTGEAAKAAYASAKDYFGARNFAASLDDAARAAAGETAGAGAGSGSSGAGTGSRAGAGGGRARVTKGADGKYAVEMEFDSTSELNGFLSDNVFNTLVDKGWRHVKKVSTTEYLLTKDGRLVRAAVRQAGVSSGGSAAVAEEVSAGAWASPTAAGTTGSGVPQTYLLEGPEGAFAEGTGLVQGGLAADFTGQLRTSVTNYMAGLDSTSSEARALAAGLETLPAEAGTLGQIAAAPTIGYLPALETAEQEVKAATAQGNLLTKIEPAYSKALEPAVKAKAAPMGASPKVTESVSDIPDVELDVIAKRAEALKLRDEPLVAVHATGYFPEGGVIRPGGPAYELAGRRTIHTSLNSVATAAGLAPSDVWANQQFFIVSPLSDLTAINKPIGGSTVDFFFAGETKLPETAKVFSSNEEALKYIDRVTGWHLEQAGKRGWVSDTFGATEEKWKKFAKETFGFGTIHDNHWTKLYENLRYNTHTKEPTLTHEEAAKQILVDDAKWEVRHPELKGGVAQIKREMADMGYDAPKIDSSDLKTLYEYDGNKGGYVRADKPLEVTNEEAGKIIELVNGGTAGVSSAPTADVAGQTLPTRAFSTQEVQAAEATLKRDAESTRAALKEYTSGLTTDEATGLPSYQEGIRTTAEKIAAQGTGGELTAIVADHTGLSGANSLSHETGTAYVQRSTAALEQALEEYHIEGYVSRGPGGKTFILSEGDVSQDSLRLAARRAEAILRNDPEAAGFADAVSTKIDIGISTATVEGGITREAAAQQVENAIAQAESQLPHPKHIPAAVEPNTLFYPEEVINSANNAQSAYEHTIDDVVAGMGGNSITLEEATEMANKARQDLTAKLDNLRKASEKPPRLEHIGGDIYDGRTFYQRMQEAVDDGMPVYEGAADGDNLRDVFRNLQEQAAERGEFLQYDEFIAEWHNARLEAAEELSAQGYHLEVGQGLSDETHYMVYKTDGQQMTEQELRRVGETISRHTKDFGKRHGAYPIYDKFAPAGSSPIGEATFSETIAFDARPVEAPGEIYPTLDTKINQVKLTGEKGRTALSTDRLTAQDAQKLSSSIEAQLNSPYPDVKAIGWANLGLYGPDIAAAGVDPIGLYVDAAEKIALATAASRGEITVASGSSAGESTALGANQKASAVREIDDIFADLDGSRYPILFQEVQTEAYALAEQRAADLGRQLTPTEDIQAFEDAAGIVKQKYTDAVERGEILASGGTSFAIVEPKGQLMTGGGYPGLLVPLVQEGSIEAENLARAASRGLVPFETASQLTPAAPLTPIIARTPAILPTVAAAIAPTASAASVSPLPFLAFIDRMEDNEDGKAVTIISESGAQPGAEGKPAETGKKRIISSNPPYDITANGWVKDTASGKKVIDKSILDDASRILKQYNGGYVIYYGSCKLYGGTCKEKCEEDENSYSHTDCSSSFTVCCA